MPWRCPHFLFYLACTAVLLLAPAVRADAPGWLPRYDLDVKIDVDHQLVHVTERVQWTNPHQTPTNKIVFNAHAHYSIPDKDVGFLAKMLEILRMAPKDCLDFDGPPLDVKCVRLAGGAADSCIRLTGGVPDSDLPPVKFGYQKDNDTALEIALPYAVGPGESVTVELEFELRLPQKQGRWGQWKGVTFLSQWLPVVAYYDDAGWQPTPFIPWHLPFFNEAGHYNVRVTLPSDQKLAASSDAHHVTHFGNGWQQVELNPICVRDFALFCSADFEEYTSWIGSTKVVVMCLPGHEWYAKEMVQIACEALPIYDQWFGNYPYPQFTVVESYFGWNGNQCGGLVMIDERIFALPHIARGFVDSLLTHEICHQWWYNLVGVNGYAETWMDEGLAVHFSHKVIDQKAGKNNSLLNWPTGLGWLPTIHRDDYRNYTMMGCLARGEVTPVVQPMPGFGHLVDLMAMTYDKGSRVVGMIEERLGRAAFFDFMKIVCTKYQYRILRVADFQRELEAYTGRSWEEFFQNWLYKTGMCDWAVDKVTLAPHPRPLSPQAGRGGSVHATIFLTQKGEWLEPTFLGINLGDGEGCQLRLPIVPGQDITIEQLSAHIVSAADGTTVVDIDLPREPTQITVDPDKVLIDSNPLNNNWKPEIKCRILPLYTQLEENDITNAYDRWNLIVGPWIYGASYDDPWYTRSEMVGFRAGVYRTQEFSAGAYIAYRTEDRNVVAGFDMLWDHCIIPQMQIGFNVERSLASLSDGDPEASRGVLFARYVLMYGDSLYLPPFHYVEAFSSIQSHNLPYPAMPEPGSDPFFDQTTGGVHYHVYLLTPYWDPEGGFALDATYQEGFPIFGEHRWSEQVFGQVSWVKSMPDWMGWTRQVPGLDWMMDSRWAFRLHGAAALPNDGLFFPLGGGDLFRGYNETQRQGSMNWVASVEWRVPIWQDIEQPYCDNVAIAKNLYAALFCDTGDSYLNGHSLGPVAYATGVGLRLDVSWFGLIERTMLRCDVAKTLNDATPWQVWFGIQHPF